MANYTAAHRARESIDVAAASRLVFMLKRDVPRMSIVLRLVSKSEVWSIVIQSITDMIRIGTAALLSTQTQWRNAWDLENTCRKAFMRARDAIEVRIITDRRDLHRIAPLYQMALEDASSEGESMPDLEEEETDEDDLVGVADVIDEEEGAPLPPLPEGFMRLTNLVNL